MSAEVIICAALAAVAVFSAFDARVSHRKARDSAARVINAERNAQAAVEQTRDIASHLNDRLARFYEAEKSKQKPSKSLSKTQVKDGVAVFQTWDGHAKKWVTQSVASGVKYRVVNGSEAGK